MCNNPRPEEQYQALLEIREQARRQRLIQEEHNRQFAMSSNKDNIQQQNNQMQMDQDDKEEEAAQKLLQTNVDDEEWNDNEFEDENDDDTWINDDDDHGNDDFKDDDFESNDGWGDVDIADSAIASTLIPQKTESFEVLNPYKLHQYQVNFMKSLSEQLYIDSMDDMGIMCRYYRWNKSELMDEYLKDSMDVMVKCGVVSSSKCLSKPITNASFDCWLCVQTVDEKNTFYPQECGHQYCNECWSNYLISQMEKGPRCVMTKCIEPKCRLTLRPSVFIKFLPYKHRIKVCTFCFIFSTFT